MLDTSLHIKATNPQTFLHFSSCHPLSTFKTVLRGELIRAIRCTSSPTTYITILDKLLRKFRWRGYPQLLLRQEAGAISYTNRAKFLHPPERRALDQDVVLFSSIFSPGVDSSAIRRALQDEDTPFTPMILRPRPLSLHDRLVRARITTITTTRADEEDTGWAARSAHPTMMSSPTPTASLQPAQQLPEVGSSLTIKYSSTLINISSTQITNFLLSCLIVPEAHAR